MIIHTTNILVLPLVLVNLAVQMYLGLVCFRLVFGWIAGPARLASCLGLLTLTDPIPAASARYLARKRTRPFPKWLPWLLVILAGLVLERIVCGLILAMA